MTEAATDIETARQHRTTGEVLANTEMLPPLERALCRVVDDPRTDPEAAVAVANAGADPLTTVPLWQSPGLGIPLMHYLVGDGSAEEIEAIRRFCGVPIDLADQYGVRLVDEAVLQRNTDGAIALLDNGASAKDNPVFGQTLVELADPPLRWDFRHVPDIEALIEHIHIAQARDAAAEVARVD